MPRKKAEVVEKTFTAIKIYSDNGLVREYSEEVHGEDYKLLAEMFAQKNNFQIVYGE